MLLEVEFVVEEDKDGLRLDSWLVDKLSPEFSRSQIQSWISKEWIHKENSSLLKASHRIKVDQKYILKIPDPEPLDIKPVDLGLNVIYEDKYLAVIHKPPGISTHPGLNDTRTSLVNGIVYRWNHLIEKENLRPGVVHRLDKDTEGLMIVGLDSKVRRDLMKLFELRKVHKEYRAWLIGGLPAQSGKIELGIQRNTKNRLKMEIHSSGRMAITEFERIRMCNSKKGRKYDFVNLNIKTGRTHQIRVHMSHLRSPVVGDSIYSNSATSYKEYGMLLYSRLLAFDHPVNGKAMKFVLDTPERFELFESSLDV